jgi:tRNA G10  N-methylase Trm11
MQCKTFFSQRILTIVQDEPYGVSTFYSRNQYHLQPYPLSEKVVGLFKIEDALRILYTTDDNVRKLLRIKFKKDYGLDIYV